MRGGLKRSTQYFISDARDGEDGDGSKICSSFNAVAKEELWDRWQHGERRNVAGATSCHQTKRVERHESEGAKTSMKFPVFSRLTGNPGAETGWK